MMMVKKSFFVILSVLFSLSIFAQDIPERPVPPKLVNDFAGMLSPQEANALEQKLVSFDQSTSTQIAIVTLSDLHGYSPEDYAQRLGEKWGIGQKGLNNGVLILVKPKTADSDGRVFIAQGYGLEGVIPDITAAEIVDKEILPSFKNGDYYGGLDKATGTLMSLASGEFTAKDYDAKAKKSGGASILPVLFIIFLVILLTRGGRGSGNRRITTGSNLPFWLLMGMMGSGGSHRGSWGGFSGGGGGGFSGGGGFGGFGGGSFGGGGAGGSW
jgi:uncharacterized protein